MVSLLYIQTQGPIAKGESMRLRIQKWGNSLALRIPKPFAQEIHARQGSEVDVALVEGKLVVSPVEQEAPNLGDLLAGVTRENLPATVDFGPPVGREIW